MEQFDYDKRLGTTANQLPRSCQFTVEVKVQRNRILRILAKFDQWAVTFVVEIDNELVDQRQLLTWSDVGGRRFSLGDWRPEELGHYSRYKLQTIQPIQ